VEGMFSNAKCQKEDMLVRCFVSVCGRGSGMEGTCGFEQVLSGWEPGGLAGFGISKRTIDLVSLYPQLG